MAEVKVESVVVEPAAGVATAPTVAAGRTGLWRSTAVRTFVVLSLAHATIDCCSGVWPIFKTLAGLDLAIAGVITMAALIVSSALQPIFGLWADHGHRRTLIIAGVALTSLMMLLGVIGRSPLVHAWSGYALMAAILFCGQLGVAMFHPAAVSLAGNASNVRRTTFVALFIATGMSGLMTSWIVFSAVYTYTGAHTEILLIPAFLVIALLWIHCRPAETKVAGPLGVGTLVRRLEQMPRRLWLLWLIMVLQSGAYNALIFLLPELAQQRGQREWLIKGGAFAVMVAGSALVMIPVGHLADRFGRRRLLRLFLAGALLSYAGLITVTGVAEWSFVMLCFLTGAFVGTLNPLGIALSQHLWPQRGSLITGLMMGMAWAAGAPAMMIVGALAKRSDTSPSQALLVMIPCMALALVLGQLVPHEGSGQAAE